MTLQRSIGRAMAITLIAAADLVPSGNIFRARSWPVKPEAMPFINVNTPSDKQANAGVTADPQFDATVVLEFDIGVRADDPGTAQDDCDTICEGLINALLTAPQFVALWEKIGSIETELAPKDEQFQYHRARIAMTFHYSEIYPPVIPNNLDLIDAKFTGPKGDTFTEVKIAPQS
jgi:hypothetical protein